jgi:uncharacterized membrane protein
VLVEFIVELSENILVVVVVQRTLDSLGHHFQFFFTALLECHGSIIFSLDKSSTVCILDVLSFIVLDLTYVVINEALDDFSEEMAVHVDVLDSFK